jgi:hemerythrin
LNANTLFLWTDDLSVSIQEVDEQHKGLIRLINQLHLVVSETQGEDTAREILDQLVESTRTHFLLEESLMRLTHYTGFETHKNQHETLMDEMRALLEQLDNGSATINVELLHFLKIWLTEHIERCDRHFSAHFAKSGLNRYSNWNQETSQAMGKKPGWWKFW